MIPRLFAAASQPHAFSARGIGSEADAPSPSPCRAARCSCPPPPADVVLGSSSEGASSPLALSRRPMQLLLDRFLYTDGSVQGLCCAMDLAGAGCGVFHTGQAEGSWALLGLWECGQTGPPNSDMQ